MSDISIRAQNIFRLGIWPVTNTLLLSTVVAACLVLIGWFLRRRLALIPSRAQSLMEIILEGALDIMESVFGDRRTAERYLPLVLTIFLFVLFSNWFGLIPGVGAVMLKTAAGSVPLFRSPASDLNFTVALALVAVIATNISGAVVLGLLKRIGVFFNFRSPIKFFVGFLELISEFAKIVSFSFRLFGNVFAGEVLLTIVAFLAPYIVPLPFVSLEVFFGFIQAFIFGMLTLIFVSIAIINHEEEEREESKGRLNMELDTNTI